MLSKHAEHPNDIHSPYFEQLCMTVLIIIYCIHFSDEAWGVCVCTIDVCMYVCVFTIYVCVYLPYMGVYVCVHACVRVCMCACTYLQTPKEGIGSPGVGFICGCEVGSLIEVASSERAGKALKWLTSPWLWLFKTNYVLLCRNSPSQTRWY